jgi:molecular chaperone DnaJ
MPGAEAMGDLYEILGVSPGASDDEIKRAYRKKAREHHPDANDGSAESEAKFKEVSFAYEVLKDPERRARYDRYGAASFNGGAGGGPSGFEGGLGDLFEAFFGAMGQTQGRRMRGPQPGSDAEVVMSLTLNEAAFGAQKELSLRIPVTCSTCSGSGAAEGSAPVTCTECGGSGEIRRVRQSLLGQIVTAAPCGRCQGFGEMIAQPCGSCRGEGRVLEDRTFTVDVPAGVDHGSTLRLADRGPAGQRGGRNGTLYVHLQVASDPRFERHDDALHTSVHLSMVQAALGDTITVETLEEPITVTVTPGTQNQAVERVKGQGVPHLRGRGRGDLFVHFIVDTPVDLNEQQRSLLNQFAAAGGEKVPETHKDPKRARRRGA